MVKKNIYSGTTNQGLVVTFNPPVIVKSVGGVNITTNKINIVKIIDDPVNKTIKSYTDLAKIFTLWSGETYDTIGQWTDNDVISRITQIIISGK